MTPELSSRLTRIESLCHACLELDAKATPGPWNYLAETEDLIEGQLPDYKNEVGVSYRKPDGDFIAQARNLCPRLARSTLTAIAALRKLAAAPEEEPDRYEGDNHGDSFSSGWACADWAIGKDALTALTEIASHFENV